MKEAAYYKKLSDKRVKCILCPHHCRIPDGRSGICLTRANRDSTLYSMNYFRPVSLAIDPVEKKPLYHFFPGSTIFSTGPNGCNFKCSFCQNSDISQELQPVREIAKPDLLEMILESGSIGIAYTYSEPYIWFETIMELGALVKSSGLKNIMVTNGFMETQPLADLLQLIDAMNIDIKSMSDSFYRRTCKGSLDPVLRTCEKVKRAGCHLEITNLLITGKNDTPLEIEKLVRFVAENLGADTPLHISRYFPRYRLDNPPTPENELRIAYEIAREKLDYVYVGNSVSSAREQTHCPSCNTLLISRSGYAVKKTDNLEEDSPVGNSARCRSCGVVTNIRIR